MAEADQTQSPSQRLAKLVDFFVAAFPQMDGPGQMLARTLYRQLALGEPLPLHHLAEMTGQSSKAIRTQLDQWGHVIFNETSDVIGLLGITVNPTAHKMRIQGHTSFAWCAWDTLFIPELVDATTQVSSSCPITGKAISLTVTPQQVYSTEPDLWLSFLLPEQQAVRENVVNCFCHHVHFLSSRAIGDDWTAQHPGSFLLSLDQAAELGRRVNAARFSTVLADASVAKKPNLARGEQV